MSTNLRTQIANTPAARFGSTYGYRFNGDNVELHASFQLFSETAHQLQWSLQLRAAPTDRVVTEPLTSLLVAEAALPPFSEFTNIGEPFFLTATATPPAGRDEFNLYLLLVAKDSNGNVATQDVAFFDRPERFCLPRFNGEISHLLTGSKIQLSVSSIENPRDPSNLSGTLSLELWALAESYTGGSFQGHDLAGFSIGHLAGQQSRHNLNFEQTLATPPPGRWHLVLMLREWTGNGFTTRDYFNFSLPLEIAAEAPAASEPTATPIVDVATPIKPADAKPSQAAKKKTSSKNAASPAKAKKTSGPDKTAGNSKPARSSKRTGK